jgi:uncharacterized caspase-like protein
MQRFFVFVLTLIVSFAAQAEPRTALVIGNGGYSYAPLANAVNDATDMAAALQAAGFEVTLKTDVDQRTMDEAVAAFGDALEEKGGVGLFYFSGHGVAIGEDNYILPVGEALSREDDVKYKAVNAGRVIDAMAGNALNIVILDSCRNKPLTASGRSASRGLARVDGGSGLFVSFATSPGEVALDGEGRNSPYTKHLVAAIGTPGLSLEETFKRTLKGVYQETDSKQVPWISSSFFGDFYFLPAGTQPAAGEAPPPSDAGGTPTAVARLDEPGRQLPPVEAAPTPAGVYHAAGVNPNGSRYRGMVTIVPSRDEFRFDWWIGKQVFQGTGRFAGRMLVVEWGDQHPVVYTFPSLGRLDGEWADGTATETLNLFAKAASDGMPAPGGRYKVNGANPDGSRYSGSVTISQTAEGYRIDWVVGQSTYQGIGVLEGNVLTVDWGSDTPVVYALASDGTLSGLWAAGNGEETLTPAR